MASRYKVPFPIYTIEEGKRFTRLTKSSFTENAIKFRVDGEELTLDYDKMHQWLGFPTKGFASKPKGWNAASVWEMLIGIMFDTLYNASRHQGKVTLGIGSVAPILTYAARMPIPPYRAQPINIFRYMDGAFLKKSILVNEVKDGNTMVYRWKSWERRVGQGHRDEGTSHVNEEEIRQRKGSRQ
ncbi:hypothetical protein JCGZ_19658 [Jatropha curcas]|uniref:Uncharacterized protein n=1 Tax=Jatropha curcas TaxID=180498 RepID=A0A067KAW4_JATCU|nr:hypothetical protein JCGZ_19658 [Jatropha curcas]